MHSPTAKTEHPSPNVAGTFLLHPVDPDEGPCTNDFSRQGGGGITQILTIGREVWTKLGADKGKRERMDCLEMHYASKA